MQRTFPLEFEADEFTGPGAGEKRLWLTVLLLSIGDLFGLVGDQQDRIEQQHNALVWVSETNPSEDWLGSFNNVCNILGVEPSYLRRALLIGDVPLTAALDRLARPRKAEKIPVDPDVVRQLFADGCPVLMIARRLSTSRRAIYRLLGPGTPGPAKRRRRMSVVLDATAA